MNNFLERTIFKLENKQKLSIFDHQVSKMIRKIEFEASHQFLSTLADTASYRFYATRGY